MLRDVIAAQPSAAQANILFTKQQGGRFQAAAQYEIGEYEKFYRAINEFPESFPEQIAKERMAGLSGAMSKLEGAVTNLGLSFIKPNETWLIPTITEATKLATAMSQLDGATLRTDRSWRRSYWSWRSRTGAEGLCSFERR